jgi:hypothetical protein
VRRREREEQGTTLDDVVEVLQGIGVVAMAISAKLDQIVGMLGGQEDEEADA